MGIRGPKSKFSEIACPNTSCRDFGIVDMENIVGNGTYETQNERVRKFVCRTCGKSRAVTLVPTSICAKAIPHAPEPAAISSTLRFFQADPTLSAKAAAFAHG